MRRYELMLVLRPDAAEDRIQAALDRATRTVTAGGGQIVKVSPWGRRRLAYPIGQHREGSYYICLFDAPAEVIDQVERGLHITEEVMRHLVTRVERPAAARRAAAAAAEGAEEAESEEGAPPEDLEAEAEGRREVIDESESEAAPAAIEQ
jgi:small subunit ribosomal protein S6